MSLEWGGRGGEEAFCTLECAGALRYPDDMRMNLYSPRCNVKPLVMIQFSLATYQLQIFALMF